MKIKYHSLGSLWRYFLHRMVSEKGDVDYIARGWALGMFIGCLIPMGLQLVIAVPLSCPLKSSKIGAVFGTFLTNPLTVWFIYPAQCWLGERLLGEGHNLDTIRTLLKDVIQEQSFAALRALSGQLLLAFFVGGLLLALILTPLTYYLVRLGVLRYRKVREKLRQHRLMRRA